MPRKKAATSKASTMEKADVKNAFVDCKAACEDTITRTVADLTNSDVITREQAERITVVLNSAVSNSIFQTMVLKGL